MIGTTLLARMTSSMAASGPLGLGGDLRPLLGVPGEDLEGEGELAPRAVLAGEDEAGHVGPQLVGGEAIRRCPRCGLVSGEQIEPRLAAALIGDAVHRLVQAGQGRPP